MPGEIRRSARPHKPKTFGDDFQIFGNVSAASTYIFKKTLDMFVSFSGKSSSDSMSLTSIPETQYDNLIVVDENITVDSVSVEDENILTIDPVSKTVSDELESVTAVTDSVDDDDDDGDKIPL